ncbi:MAG: 30S ribosomal protein S8 [Verrucomicrobiota bacterium]|nr:30S ribosomal protein S8 [Limisphaera sp.]MDW8382705.1 30S ribosomal protein S8 [Verrucomicrobiota bacterium]
MDPIADMLTRIRNGARALHPVVEVPWSRLKENIAAVLRREGFLADFTVCGEKVKTLRLHLKYRGKRCVIEGLRRVSKPGLRYYVGAQEIPKVRGGLGVAIVSTSEGVMTGYEARRKNLGGELICYVW